jgi:hypothetical protein
MDETTMLAACSCAALAILVYLMWRSATASEWAGLTQSEKRRWRMEEEQRKEGKK